MKPSEESLLQIKVHPELKAAIAQAAADRGDTIRAFILKALQKQGIDVRDADLVDRRIGSHGKVARSKR